MPSFGFVFYAVDSPLTSTVSHVRAGVAVYPRNDWTLASERHCKDQQPIRGNHVNIFNSREKYSGRKHVVDIVLPLAVTRLQMDGKEGEAAPHLYRWGSILNLLSSFLVFIAHPSIPSEN
jgi:hypothetical protein